MKPLFIPLKTEFYEAFVNGSKTTEYRRHGPRWNSETCRVGRPVVLSKGYGKAHRTNGRVVDFYLSKLPSRTDAWRACYGNTGDEVAACICIAVDQPGERQ